MGGAAKAQSLESKFGVDSIQTLQNASIYSEFLKQKNYKDALPAWSYVFHNAPMFQMSTYTKGEDLFMGLYRQTKDMAYVDSLRMVYDQWIKYSSINPRYGEGYILGKKGASLIQLGLRGDDNILKEAYGYLNKSFEMEGTKSHPVTLQVMFLVAGDLIERDLMTREDYINLYMKVSDFIDHSLKNAKKPEPFQDMKQKIDGMFFASGVADCQTLDQLLTKKYNQAPNDVDNLRSIVSLLRRNECEDLNLYTVATEELYKMEPSADAAYSLAMMFLKRQETEKADTYFAEAIEKATQIAKRNMHDIALKGTTIPHHATGKFGRGQVVLLPAEPGTGVIAGGPVRAVLEVSGIKDIRTKSIGSNNPINCAKATLEGLCSLRSAEQIAQLRGVDVEG